jgi:hypothetical protein
MVEIAAKNQDGVMWTIFSTKIQLQLHLAAFWETLFGANLFFFLKKVIWDFKIWQNGHKIQNGVRNLHFLKLIFIIKRKKIEESAASR